MSTDVELMARELRRVMESVNLSAASVRAAKRKRPKPQAAIDVAVHCERATRCLRAAAGCVVEAGDAPTPEAWSALVMAAVCAGTAAGIALEYERRAAGNGNRGATERSRRLDELAAQPMTAYQIAATEHIAGMEPESVAQALRRRRKRSTRE